MVQLRRSPVRGEGLGHQNGVVLGVRNPPHHSEARPQVTRHRTAACWLLAVVLRALIAAMRAALWRPYPIEQRSAFRAGRVVCNAVLIVLVVVELVFGVFQCFAVHHCDFGVLHCVELVAVG